MALGNQIVSVAFPKGNHFSSKFCKPCCWFTDNQTLQPHKSNSFIHLGIIVLVGRLREIIVHFVIKAPYSQKVYRLIWQFILHMEASQK